MIRLTPAKCAKCEGCQKAVAVGTRFCPLCVLDVFFAREFSPEHIAAAAAEIRSTWSPARLKRMGRPPVKGNYSERPGWLPPTIEKSALKAAQSDLL